MASHSLLFLISCILLLISQTVSHPNISKFLECLPNHSKSLIPISEAIYYRNDASFLYVLQSYIRNERFNKSTTPKPLAIIAALDESHVQATIICAKAHGLNLRIRSGGHDYEGLSYVSPESFILLDMFNLRAIDIDVTSETAWAEAGATLGELYYKIANLSNKLAFPAGVSPTLGLGGHISGGGYGNLMRKYGLSSDNVIDAKVVDANGKILDRESMGEDLFWAIQGGGASSFCVVLAWKLKLVRVPEVVTVFNVRRTLEQGVTDILDQWQRVVPKIDPSLFIRAMPHVINGSRENNNKTIEVTFIALYLGRANQLVNLVSKSFPLLGLQLQDCIEMPWIKTILHWYGFPHDASIRVLLSRTPMTQYYAKFRSDYVQQPIPKEGLEAIWKKMIALEVMFMQFNPYGGKMSEILETTTPFPHRARNLFKIQYNAMWYEDGEDIARRYLNASEELYDTLAPYVSKNPREHFLNYRDIDIGTNKNGNTSFGFQYFKWNLPRLLVTKAKVDPDNFFRYEQSIPVVSRLI